MSDTLSAPKPLRLAQLLTAAKPKPAPKPILVKYHVTIGHDKRGNITHVNLVATNIESSKSKTIGCTVRENNWEDVAGLTVVPMESEYMARNFYKNLKGAVTSQNRNDKNRRPNELAAAIEALSEL